MRRALLYLLFVVAAGLMAGPVAGQDIRAAARKARADRERAETEARATEEAIFADRQALTARVDSLAARQAALQSELDAKLRRQEELRTQLTRLEAAWGEQELDFRETTGNIRLAARDAESMLKASPLSAGQPERVDRVSALLAKGYFPDLEDIGLLTAVLLDEIQRSGQVTVATREFVGRNGEHTTGRVFQLGKFTSLYSIEGEKGFLTHAPESQELYALSRLPDRSTRRLLAKYLAGESDIAPVDLSGGAALRQMTVRTGITDQLREGGPLVWPILLLGLIALIIVVGKFISLNRVHANTDKLMGEVNVLAAKEDWAGCERLVADVGKGQKPVVRVIKAGLAARGRSRVALESVLQEAILHELPSLQRGLAVLAVMGAVAPLLGLLGTVTGMIETFRVITVFGTGDPKLMSGGISEALVTTELGLAVAIPIMLVHTLLSRRADHILGDMEKQAVGMTNLIAREEAD